MHKHDLAALKERLLIPDVWRRLGLPGLPTRSCRSPFRPDKVPSFSIYDGGRRWKDFGTEERGDVIDFIARACDIDLGEATRCFLRLAGGEELPTGALRAIRQVPGDGPDRLLRNLRKAKLHHGSREEVEAVARIRRIDQGAVRFAQELSILQFGSICGFPCWILIDAARMVAEARRLDGRHFPSAHSLPERKAHTLGGSTKSWPVGVATLREIPDFRAVLLVEGGPDLLAALHFIHLAGATDLFPIAMLGRGTGYRIAPEALHLLARRRVRVYPHVDQDGGGIWAAEAWAAQLTTAGCHVEIFNLNGLIRRDGKPVSDLNDAVLIHQNEAHELADLLP